MEARKDILIKKFPTWLWTQTRALATLQDVKVSDVVELALSEYLETHPIVNPDKGVKHDHSENRQG